jgi:hypothetical protein
MTAGSGVIPQPTGARLRSAPLNPITGLAPKKNALRPALQLSGARARKKPARWNAAYHERISTGEPIQPHPEAFIQTTLELLASDRYLQKAWASWPSPGAGLPRSSSVPSSASLEKNSIIPTSPSNWRTRQAHCTSFEPYPIPVLADPRKIIRALAQLRELKSSTTGPPTPQIRFRRLRLPRPTMETRTLALEPTAPSVATSSNPKTSPTNLPRTNPRSYTPRSQCIPLRRPKL